jgi:hypothetical protein
MSRLPPPWLAGFPASAAPQLASAIARPGSAVQLATLNVPILIGALLGRRGGPGLRELDLRGAGALRPEDAALLAAALEGATSLQSVGLPPDAALGAAALQGLVAALARLPALRSFNGVELAGLQGSRLDCSGRALGDVGGALLAHKVSTNAHPLSTGPRPGPAWALPSTRIRLGTCMSGDRALTEGAGQDVDQCRPGARLAGPGG